jgi:hypothetical protein
VGGAAVPAPVLARRWPKEEETDTDALLYQQRKKEIGTAADKRVHMNFFFKFFKQWFLILGSGKIVRQ